ncbi:MAG: GNAT family N-acetyltransferase [Oscillospiraceae bacterium]|jgi:GNAT superfamily N-acetyltransferase|nr:GNAT family N-acetyltransferase [Oscillospiraceae bacterium]
MTKREAAKPDLPALLELYKHLNADPIPDNNERITAIWEEILADKNHRILLIEVEGKAIATCVLIIVPNLTRGARPYAIIENVVTRPEARRKGYGKAVLDYAKEIAAAHNCYKIMLMTGRKDEATLRFYENAGYNRTDKTAFIQWLL